MNRAEVIAALVTDKFSGFKDGDEQMLETVSDTRLDEFRGASEQRKSAAAAFVRLETENRNVQARLTVAENRIKEMEQPLSEDEFMDRAPASIKTLIDAHRAAEATLRASLVSQLKDLGAQTEEELKKLPTEQLRTLAVYAHVEIPDFSGRGLPVERSAAEKQTRSYAPPDAYAAGLKQMREASARR